MPSASTLSVPNGTHQFLSFFTKREPKKAGPITRRQYNEFIEEVPKINGRRIAHDN
jgi:hypothetical protein